MSLDLFVHHFSNTYSPSIVSLFQSSRLWDTKSPLGPVNSLLVTQCRGSEWVLTFVLFCFVSFFLSTLQFCIGFAIHQHEFTMGVHAFPILNPPPTTLPIPSLWVIPVHQPQGSCIKTGLAIHFLYDIIHVLMPFSQTIPPPQGPKDCTLYARQQKRHRCISLSILNEIFARYSNLGFRFFPFSTLTVSCHSLLAWGVCAERSAVKCMGFPCMLLVPFLLLLFFLCV